jgi:YD repeat-containing protein
MTTSYSGNKTTMKDPAGCQQTTVTDALGRLTQVIEDPSSTVSCNGNSPSSHFAYSTSYSYDAMDDLKVVNQSGRTRSFLYDSLKRLVSANNPETGLICYGKMSGGNCTESYDASGNLLNKTDANGNVTTYQYDALNRLIAKSYSGPYATPSASWTYCNATSACSNVPYSVGRLLSASNSTSTTNYTSYDPLGRVVGSAQQTNGQTYSFAYTYNVAGGLTSETYPSGRVVSTSFDESNQPFTLSGALSGQTTNYITQTAYWPHGGIYYFVRGNNVWHAASFNSRLQQTESYEALNNSSNSMLFVSCPNWGQYSNL